MGGAVLPCRDRLAIVVAVVSRSRSAIVVVGVAIGGRLSLLRRTCSVKRRSSPRARHVEDGDHTDAIL